MTKNKSININIEHFKEKLEQEKKLLEGELGSVGRVNPNNPKDWEATPSPIDVMPADKTEVAEQMEEFEERTAIEVELENKLNSIKKALKRIEEGGYGVCEICGEPIEEARLEANPAATTCLKHLNK